VGKLDPMFERGLRKSREVKKAITGPASQKESKIGDQTKVESDLQKGREGRVGGGGGGGAASAEVRIEKLH